ncbi:vacuolar protein sorting-associated protein Vps17 [Ascobolus immersus RN42]|uniref:Vacuolar protein sorting-associated protein 17 n=1 Tax=Ascobolus immersus RN42 TaxID=1160509 RepID=A0A3N4IB34_ASCIM|nr:vacuolar protein sorting-associated protein Vps17 [Ascobolus immersus RN42]
MSPQFPGYQYQEQPQFQQPAPQSPPQQQSQRPQAHQQQSRQSIHQQQRPQHYLHAKITALERTGRKNPILRFDVHTNLPAFRTTQFRDVRRTHSEFIKLAEHLTASTPECLVPQVPPSSTSAGVGTEEDEIRVRAGMQRWLNVVCSNPVLMRDEEVMIFVEGDFGYSPSVRKKQPATGVRRKVLKQFAPPQDDTPALAEARPVVKAFYLGTMETGQKLDKVVKNRRGLGLAEADLGVRLAQISLLEGHQGMANAYRKLGKTIQSVGDFHAAQATSESTTLSDPLTYHSQDSFIVKETLTNRQILIRELLQAQSTLRSRLQTAERMKSSTSVRKDKVDEAIAALDEARRIESTLAAKCKRVTSTLLIEQKSWFQRTSQDLRNAIRDYTIRQIEAERRTLATLENVRPDIRAIDSSGGLSRLGRDAPPASRRASVAASQGPRGDAWSGVKRSDSVNRAALVSGNPPILGVAAPSAGGPAGLGKDVGSEQRGLGGVKEEEDEDEDRIDAKNAASRLATSTF